MIAGLVVTLMIALIVALAGAYYESELIQENIDKGVTEDLDHGSLTATRVIIIGCTALFTSIWATWGAGPTDLVLAFVSSLGASYGLFSPVHRYVLNTSRRLSWSYMGKWNATGSWYDEVFWWAAWVVSGLKREKDPSPFERMYSTNKHKPIPPNEELPARIAYIWELLVLIASIIVYFR